MNYQLVRESGSEAPSQYTWMKDKDERSNVFEDRNGSSKLDDIHDILEQFEALEEERKKIIL